MFIKFLQGSLGIFAGYVIIWLLSVAFFIGSLMLIMYFLLG